MKRSIMSEKGRDDIGGMTKKLLYLSTQKLMENWWGTCVEDISRSNGRIVSWIWIE